MKLSEAIRLGSMLRPQCKGLYFTEGGSCALGAAYEATYSYPGDETIISYSKFEEAYPILKPSGVTDKPSRLAMSITNLNDIQGWTREQIADFVEKVERRTEQHELNTIPTPIPQLVPVTK